MASVTKGWKIRFFTIWTGQQLSMVGSYAAQFALVWWLTMTTGSATVLATASMVALIPQIILGPFAGALIDRWNRRAVMLLADSFIALVSLWLAYMFWIGAMEVWHVYVAMLARSLGGAFHWPAMAASTTLMVPGQHLARVSGLNQTMHGALTIAGPPLGALLMSLLPLHGVMMVDVGTALFAVVPLLFIAVPQPAREHVDALKGASFLSNTREGLRFVVHWPGLMALLAGALVLKVALTPAFSLMPLLVRNGFGGGAPELSLLEAIAGVGILGGGLTLSAWGGFKRKIYTILMGLTGIGIGIGIMGLAPGNWFWMALGGAFLVGWMVSMTDGPIMAIMQATVPAQMQGRVFALIGSLVSLSTPIGLALAGPVSDSLGVRFWFLLAGILCLGVAVTSLFIPSLLHIEDQKPVANGISEKEAAVETVPRPGFNTATD